LCNATYTNQALNLTFYDEVNQTNVDATANPTTIQGNFKYWIGTGSVYKNYTLNNLTSTVNNRQFCITPNSTMQLDSDITYSAVNYDTNNYYIRNATLTGISNDILLYLIPTAVGQKFYNTVQQGVVFIPNVIVQVQKFFVGLGVYKTVSIQLTDSDGKFPMYMTIDGQYRFNVIQDGVLLGTVDKTASCATTPCSVLIKITGTTNGAFDYYNSYYANQTVSTLTFDRTSKMIVYTFSDLTGLAHYFRLEVDSVNYQTNGSVICNVISYSTAGSLTCNMTGYYGDFTAQGYISRSPEKDDPLGILSFVIDEDVVANMGLDAIFLILGVLITLVFAAAVISKGNPSIIIFVFGAGILGLKLINLLPYSWVIVAVLEALIFYILIKLKV
jgi:hypothetical protein